MKWRTENDRELGRVIDSLMAQIRDAQNQQLVIWERTLRLHLKPKPAGMPDAVWRRLVNLVVTQSSQESFLQGNKPMVADKPLR